MDHITVEPLGPSTATAVLEVEVKVPRVQFWYPSDYCAQRSVSFDKIFLVLSIIGWGHFLL